MIETMKKDPISSEFVHQRIKELFQEIVFSERQVIIEKLSSQYAYVKAQFTKLQQDRANLEQNMDERLSDSLKMIDLLKQELSRETHKRTFIETEYQKLQQQTNQITYQFEQALRKKELIMQDKFDKDQNQANYLSNKLSEAELRIDDRER